MTITSLNTAPQYLLRTGSLSTATPHLQGVERRSFGAGSASPLRSETLPGSAALTDSVELSPEARRTMGSAKSGGAAEGTSFQAAMVDALNAVDERNESLLDQVIEAAESVSDGETADVTLDDRGLDHGEGAVEWGGRSASLSGTGGVALLEYAKDAIQTAVSNVSGVAASESTLRKVVERKLSDEGGGEDDDKAGKKNNDD